MKTRKKKNPPGPGDSPACRIVTAAQCFEAQVKQTPARTALAFADKLLTYSELNQRANRLAHYLRGEWGISPGKIVALVTAPSPETLVGIFGIMKAGAAYLPVDPAYPPERIAYLLNDSRPDLVLMVEKVVIGERVDCPSLELSKAIRPGYPAENPGNLNVSSDPVYIIYTSGSTGTPKGVIVEHGNLMAYLHAFNREFTITSWDVMLQQSSYSFDAVVEEIFPPLLSGARVAIARKRDNIDPHLLAGLVARYHITMVSCSPMVIRQFNRMEGISSIHTYISGGDVLQSEYIHRLVKKARVYNTYGPTETTVCSNYYQCPPDLGPTIPLGKPITNYSVYIRDRHGLEVPGGVTGEICISGPGVSRGYLNRPLLTLEKFSPQRKSTPGRCRLYKTGDLGRRLPDGTMEFLGRMDRQIQLRGFRIEPGEIENRILQYGGIHEALVVAARGRAAESYLCAYFTAGEKIPRDRLRHHLAQVLPHPMIPAHLVQLERFPLTLQGKIDHHALPGPEIDRGTAAPLSPPGTPLEKELAEMWSRILDIDRENVSIDDNFFRLGGHSTRATDLVTAIHRQLKITLPVKEVYKNPTIRDLARYVESQAMKE
jgi:amino acid adenylation domain-containing protein